jgi:Epoxide hydrolase N terminus
MTKQIEAFKLSVPDIDIADLRERLRHTCFPDQAPGPAWAYGTDVAWMRGLIDYWEKNSIGVPRKPVSTPSRSSGKRELVPRQNL